jgi:hypothetical protein
MATVRSSRRPRAGGPSEDARADDGRLPFLAVDADQHPSLVRREADALGAGADGDALPEEDLPDRLRDVLVLAGDEPRRLLDDGHLRPEAPVHLAELEADVGATDDNQVFGHPIQAEDGGVGEVGHVADAGHVRHYGTTSHIDEDARRLEDLAARAESVRPLEAGVLLDDRAPASAAQMLLDAGPRVGDDLVGPRLDLDHVDRDGTAGDDPVVGSAPGDVGGPGARDERLGRHAPGVDAGSAEEVPLEEGDGQARLRQPPDQRRPRLAGPDDDRVEAPHRAAIRISRAPPRATAGAAAPGPAQWPKKRQLATSATRGHMCFHPTPKRPRQPSSVTAV